MTCRRPSKHPCVVDMILFVPRRLYNPVLTSRDPGVLSHDGIEALFRLGINRADFATLLWTLHDSNTALDWNPVFKIVNRSESSEWHSTRHAFDKESSKEIFQLHNELDLNMMYDVNNCKLPLHFSRVYYG